MIRFGISFILIFMLLSFDSMAQMPMVTISWKKIAEVPKGGTYQKSLGLAGAINGVNNNVMIIAGGSNFPNGLPW